MKIKIGKVGKPFYFKYERVNGEVDFLWKIERGGEKNTRFLWLCYSNAKRDKRIWGREKGKYHFCLQIPNIIVLDTTYVGKPLFGSRINLTQLLWKNYYVVDNSSENEVYSGD